MKTVMLGVICVGLVAATQADVLIYDSFDGAAGALNGTTTTAGGATWNASANLNTDGASVVSAGTSATYNGYLPFTLEAGKVYTLSAKVDMSSGSDWVGVGFTTGSTTNNAFYDNAAPWALYKDNGGAGSVESFGAWLYEGSGGKVSADLGGADLSGEVLLEVVVDTTASLEAASWSMSANSVEFHSGAWGGTPAITGVGFGVVDGGDISATVDDFTLSVIPEPATVSMVAVFGAGILFVRRRLMI